MDGNDRFDRQSGEDANAHFGRLARDIWSAVDDLRRVTMPAFEQRLVTLERQLERARSDHDRDEAVRKQENKATDEWRSETRKRLQRVEDQVDAIRIAAGLPQHKSAGLEISFQNLVLIGLVLGGILYELFRRSGAP